MTNPAAALAYEISTEWPALTGTEAASEAILQRLAAAGWRWVPVEMTPAMCEVMCEMIDRAYGPDLTWENVLAAAPGGEK